MAGNYSNGDSGGPIAAINVTPLVDVMLVLLVIFMITAPIMQQGVEVNLPKATTAPVAGSSEQVVLSIDKAGRIFLGAGNELALPEISKKLESVMATRPVEEQKLYIRGDTTISYGKIMEVIGEAHRAGIHQVGLISEPLDTK